MPPPSVRADHDPSRATTASVLQGRRVLAVDDQPESTRLIRLALAAALGVEVREVNDPARALVAALDFRPDAILLDVEMPGMNGGVLWRQFRVHPDFRRLPIVFLTSLVSEEECSPVAVDATTQTLAKPVTPARLSTCLAGLLSRQPGGR